MSLATMPRDLWLLEPEWLHQHLHAPDVRVLDCTTVMTPQSVGPSRISSGRPQWLAEHIPGSVHACMVADFSDPDGTYPYTLPQPAQASANWSRLGISAAHHVVLVVAAQAMVATRAWWVLRALGHQRVSILNGGLPRWRAEGRPLVPGEEAWAPTQFEARLQHGWCVNADAVAQAITAPDQQLVNALSLAQFEGSGGAHYGRPGRIPQSISVPAATMLAPDGMNWLTRERLLRVFAEADVGQQGQTVITYCGGGIAASVVGFALRWTGLAEAQLYDNSLLEWSQDPDRPMAVA